MAVAATRAASKVAGLGARLGLPTSAAELAASLSPADYVYGSPTEAQLQRLLRQQMGASQSQGGTGNQQTSAAAKAANGFGPQTALQGAAAPAAAAAAKPCPLSGSLDDLFNNHLDLDDDCLKLLLGEDEDESRPCASGGSSAAAAKAAAGSGGSSEKSSGTEDLAAGGAGEVEAASLPFAKEEDDDIAMLFGEPLDLQLLGAGHLGAATAEDSDDTGSAAGGDGAAAGCGDDDGEVMVAAADAGAGLKRSKQCGGGGGGATAPGSASPSGRGLMLSMNYEAAAESINFELLASGKASRKVPSCGDGFESMLPLLSPIPGFVGVDTPDSPDSLASGSDAVAPLPLALTRQDSSSKRKRAVRQ